MEPLLASTGKPAANAASAAPAPMPHAHWALGVLLAINLINYMDRYILSAVLPLIKDSLHASDAQLGALASAFMLVYMFAAVPIAYLADRFSRKALIAFGVVFWSLCTAGSGVAASFPQLFTARAAVGVGESCYGSISPSFVAEYFPPEKRAGALSIFSMAIPVGSALGFVLGGAVGQFWGWRQAFYIGGVPGLLLAYLACRLQDPREGLPAKDRPKPPTFRQYLALAGNRSFALCTLSMAAMTFGLGAFAVWMPTFYVRVWSMNLARANAIFGAVTVLSGVFGTLAGGWIADRVYRVTPGAYFLVSGLGLLAAVPLGLAAIYSTRPAVGLAALFLTEFCAFLNMGPLNAVIVAVTGPNVRAMAFAANIFVIHALGDAASPAIIGLASDHFGLKQALGFSAASLAVAGLLSLWGMKHFERDALAAVGHA